MRRKQVILNIAFLLFYYFTNAQTVNITSFQHVIRWVNESAFPPYVTNEKITNTILDSAASSIRKHFTATSVVKPAKLDYKNIVGFGKPSLKDPPPSANESDLQVSILSFITRATTGLEVFWSMKVQVNMNNKPVYTREIKHQLGTYSENPVWFTPAEFTNTFATLLDELFENKPSGGYIISFGTKPVNRDSVLKADSEVWQGVRNKKSQDYKLPSFSDYKTIGIEKIDTASFKKKSVTGKNTSLEYSGRTLSGNQTKTVETKEESLYNLFLQKGADTIQAFFSDHVYILKEKTTTLGVLLKNPDAETNLTNFRNRYLSGTISVASDTLQWNFSIDNYVSNMESRGTLYNNHDTLTIKIKNPASYATEVILINSLGDYVAALFFNAEKINIFIYNNLSETYRQVIAALFAVIINTK